MNYSSFKNTFRKIFITITEPKNIEGFFSNFVLAFPRILTGFFLATMFGGDKFGVPWSFSDTGLSLFEVVDWFPKDVAEFGFPFSKAPVLFAWLGAASEAIGGMFLLFGLQTRVSGFFISCTMLVAIFLQKWGGPLWGMLPAMGFLWVSLYAVVFGSGKFGLDYLLAKKLKSISSLKFSIPPKASVVSILLLISIMITKDTLAQERGNGTIVTKIIEVDSFSKISNGLSSNFQIIAGKDQLIKVTIDKNLVDLVKVEVVDGELIIDQKEWISASMNILVEISVPQLIAFQNSAHGYYSISGIKNESITIQSTVGDVNLSGSTRMLGITTNVGSIDAFNLVAEKASIKIGSWGTIKVNAKEIVNAEISKNGNVEFANKVDVLSMTSENGSELVREPKRQILYIDIKLKNNSIRRVHVEIKGPEGARFGYGVSFNMLQSRSERFPVGTEIYLKDKSSNSRLLLVVKEGDADKTLKLF